MQGSGTTPVSLGPKPDISGTNGIAMGLLSVRGSLAQLKQAMTLCAKNGARNATRK